MLCTRSLRVIWALAIGIVAVLCSGCAQAQGPEQQQNPLPPQANSQVDNQSLVHQSPPAPADRPAPNPGEASTRDAPSPKQPNAAAHGSLGEKAPDGLAGVGKKPVEDLQANRSAKPSKEPGEKPSPISGKLSPGAKPSDSSEKPKPIYGLPLEYHFDLPEVPQRIQGPTPMPVVSKPALPGPLPHRE
jgi:hypothetical protein